MKAIIIIYILAGIVVISNQFLRYLTILLLLTGITFVISLFARLFRSYATISWANRIMLRFGGIIIILLVALITVKPILGLF